MTAFYVDCHRFAATRRPAALAGWFLQVVAGLMLIFGGAAANAAPQPNFLFILADDLGWRDLGCYGSPFYETPHVDELAASGTRFTNAYAACPVCSPTRASILTGKYPVRTGITTWIDPDGGNQPENWGRNTKLLPASYADRLAHDEVTLAEALKDAGYATFFAGKWHLGPEGSWPDDHGFDVNKGGTEYGGPWSGNKYFSPYGNPNLEDGPPGEHLPDRLARETVQFIEEHQDEPFLAYLSFYSVHTPLIARLDLKDKYEMKARRIGFAGPRFIREGTREARQVQDHAVYAAMVEAMDQAVGKTLEALELLDLSERTVVIFMSDNGGLSTSEGSPTANVPLRAGKGWMYEGGVREPMIIRAPGAGESGRVEHEPVTSTDFYPTMLELAGLRAKPEQHVDGASLVPLLKGEEFDRGPVFWHYPHYGNQGGAPGAAIRDGQWKLIKWYEDNTAELFHLGKDPGEKYDLSELKPALAQRLEERLDGWLETVDANMPSPNGSYDPDAPSGRLPPEQR